MIRDLIMVELNKNVVQELLLILGLTIKTIDYLQVCLDEVEK